MTTACRYYAEGSCRSCERIDLEYAQQLAGKEEVLQTAFGVSLEPTVRSDLTGFRNRAKLSVTGTPENPIIGLPGEQGLDLDQGRELLECPIHHPGLNGLFSALPEVIRTFNLIPYNIERRTGELKGLIAFYGADQLYLRFVLRSKECVSRIRKALPTLQRLSPALVCVSANIQPVPHAILEGPEEILITERGFIDYQLGALQFRLSPQAFVQTNTKVATRLYESAARWISEIGKSHPAAKLQRCMELYSGQGAFSFFSAPFVERMLGVEINAEAVRNANETAGRLGLSHLSFRCADAAAVEAELQAFQPDLLLVNPPRRGLGKALELLLRHPAPHLIYSSCDAETLTADIKRLSEVYELKRIQLFDMFPHTPHFETLTWLSARRETRPAGYAPYCPASGRSK